MTITIHPSPISGTVQAPPSKSVAQRAMATAMIRPGITTLQGIGTSADELVLLQLLTDARCIVSADGRQLVIDGRLRQLPTTVDFGESGLAARMLTPLLALDSRPLQLTGRGTLLGRSMAISEQSLSALGVQVSPANGRLPMHLQGPLMPADIIVDGSVSSQFISGLILAYTAAGADEVTIQVHNPVSKPYIALTLKVLDDMRLPVPESTADYTRFTFHKKLLYGGAVTYAIEGDWSGAAFLAVAAAIAGSATIRNLDMFTAQADKAMLQPLMETGLGLSVTMEELVVRRAPLKAFHFNATDCPDLFPPLAVLATCCNGTSVIEGVHRLKHKESDRGRTLQEELGKLGARISFQEDMMLIEGGHPLNGGTVRSHGDHRIAMACAVAALRANAPVTIEDAEAIDKSYPQFFADLELLGVKTSVHE